MDAKNLWLSNIIIIRMKKYLLMANFEGVTTQTFFFFVIMLMLNSFINIIKQIHNLYISN